MLVAHLFDRAMHASNMMNRLLLCQEAVHRSTDLLCHVGWSISKPCQDLGLRPLQDRKVSYHRAQPT